MSAFRLNLPALIGVFQKGYDEEEHTFEVLNEMVRQLRADPRGKDLPEDPSEALDVLLRCSAALDAAGEEMPAVAEKVIMYGKPPFLSTHPGDHCHWVQEIPPPPVAPPPERAPYAVSDQHALDLALAFLDDVLADAGLSRVNRTTLPPLGATGWATAWLAQATLAKCAAARVRHHGVQRRIYVAAMELERVLFGLFDRAVPMAEEAPTSPKGGRRAAT